MALLLGIDTGGTFTDAVLMDGEQMDNSAKSVIAKSKALTTRHDLSIGIEQAVSAVLSTVDADCKDISLVSLSTTLATNALVEGQGGRVALISIGFEERDLNNAGLRDALGTDPLVMLPGGHSTHGVETQALDLSTLEDQCTDLAGSVTGFAIAGYFAVRNPSHEIVVRDFLTKHTNRPMTCSHELSAKLNGPKRALTTVLNARLVPMITRLIASTRKSLSQHAISAPVMIVRGDGALVSAEFATQRPIETILSGPAASLVGAHYLTGNSDAIVNDIGGTTSDVALLDAGVPKIDPDGAFVGGYRTMVEAVAMHTFGLGGDSEISLGGNSLSPTIVLGPRRLVPISLVANSNHSIVHASLDKQLKSTLHGRHDGRFAFRSGTGLEDGLSTSEARLLSKLTDEPQPLSDFLENSAQAAALTQLVQSGLVMVSGLTPSDALHALGDHKVWDDTAALKALQLFARKRDGRGQAFMNDPLALAKAIRRQVERRSAEVVLETALTASGKEGRAIVADTLVRDTLTQRAMDPNKRPSSLVSFDITVDRPWIGLGASAHQYHPAAAHLLATTAIVPKHADVANAIGAIVGQVAVKIEITITQPSDGRFHVTGIEEPFADEAAAFEAAEALGRAMIDKRAQEAGATDAIFTISRQEKRAKLELKDVLVEATITASATGRPPVAQ